MASPWQPRRHEGCPRLASKNYKGLSQGWLIFRDIHEENIFSLWYPLTLTSKLIHLPPINFPHLVQRISAPYSCILTCLPHINPIYSRPCIVFILCDCFVFSYRLFPHQHCNNWVPQRLDVEGVITFNFEQAIMTNNGVIYALARGTFAGHRIFKCLFILVVSDYENLTIKVTSKVTLPSSCSYSLYSILESCGFIYVLETSICSESSRINDIKLWQLNFPSMSWVEVDCLEDRAFFFNHHNNGSGWCWANNETGVEPNSVYFLESQKHSVYMYKLHDCILTPVWEYRDWKKPWDLPAWVVMPQHHQRSFATGQKMINNVVDSEMLSDLDQNRTMDDLISLLPAHLIPVIAKNLHLFDYFSFRGACKRFLSELPALPQWRTNNSLPLFVFPKNNSGLCQIMDPCRNDSHFISIPLPSRCHDFIDFSKNGWLLFGMSSTRLKYLNLYTGVSGDFPSFDDLHLLASIGFSTCPTSSDCLTVGIHAWDNNPVIAYYLHGEEAWKIKEFEHLYQFSPGISSPVFVNGEFYFLDQSGYLGVFKLEEGKPSMRVYDEPELLSTRFYSNHLVECDGQVLSVFIDDVGRCVQVFRFDHLEQKWVEIKDLGNNILFINYNTSFSMAAPELGMGNRIYLSRLYRNNIVYYSLETGKFHTFGSEHSMDNLYGTSEQFRCCWV